MPLTDDIHSNAPRAELDFRTMIIVVSSNGNVDENVN